jgi:hypothetical protein
LLSSQVPDTDPGVKKALDPGTLIRNTVFNNSFLYRVFL